MCPLACLAIVSNQLPRALNTLVRHCYNSVLFPVEEIVSYSQMDLSPEYIAILDAHNCVYIWTGTYSCATGRESAIHLAMKYLKSGLLILNDFFPLILCESCF